ncbi:MAG: hypothetical protein V3T65_08235, partial [Acidobacteriota bacterium]
GWRLAGIHGVGSHAARLFIQMIESVIESKGLTVQDIRNLRMTMEHAEVMGALPDVMEGLKSTGYTSAAARRGCCASRSTSKTTDPPFVPSCSR